MNPPAPELRDELPRLEATLLWSIRTWVAGCKRGAIPHELIGPVFAELRSPQAPAYLDGLLHALNAGCTRMIHVQCLCRPWLSEDEVVLLDAFALEQAGWDGDATALLEVFARPAEASEAAGNVLGIVQALNGSGHVLTRAAAALDRDLKSTHVLPCMQSAVIRRH